MVDHETALRVTAAATALGVAYREFTDQVDRARVADIKSVPRAEHVAGEVAGLLCAVGLRPVIEAAPSPSQASAAGVFAAVWASRNPSAGEDHE